MDSRSVLVDAVEGIATLTLNRPEAMNALSDLLIDELLARLVEFDADSTTRVIVLTGAGRAFCAGGDVKTMGADDARDDQQKLEHLRYVHRLPLAIARSRKITIAMLNGPAVGAGLGIALACDFRIAGQSARLSAAFVRVGMATDCGVSWHLPRLVGTTRAREILYSGEAIDADTARADGLVSQVCADAELATVSRTFARRFASGPTLAIAHIKRNLAVADELSLEDLLDVEARTQIAAVATADHREAVRAFREKRSPCFVGS